MKIKCNVSLTNEEKEFWQKKAEEAKINVSRMLLVITKDYFEKNTAQDLVLLNLEID